jgi:hypothetical protein
LRSGDEVCQREFDKAERRIEVSATVSEAVAQAFENTKALREGGALGHR